MSEVAVPRRDVVIDQVGGILSREGLVFEWDERDGGYRLFFESAMILVDVVGDDDRPAVRIHCPLLFDVDAEGRRAAILARLNHLNGQYRFIKTFLSGTTVVSHYAMPAGDLSARDFMAGFRMLTGLSESLDDTLKAELGGARAVDVMDAIGEGDE